MLAAQAPTKGTVPRIMPVKVKISKGGLNKSRSEKPDSWAVTVLSFNLKAIHLGESGRKKKIKIPRTAGAPAR